MDPCGGDPFSVDINLFQMDSSHDPKSVDAEGKKIGHHQTDSKPQELLPDSPEAISKREEEGGEGDDQEVNACTGWPYDHSMGMVDESFVPFPLETNPAKKLHEPDGWSKDPVKILTARLTVVIFEPGSDSDAQGIGKAILQEEDFGSVQVHG